MSRDRQAGYALIVSGAIVALAALLAWWGTR